MSRYLTLFDIGVEHRFFNGPCPCLQFVPTDNTKRLIDNTGLLVRKTTSGVIVAYDENRLEALRLYLEDDPDGLSFVFKVYSTDAEFHTYTEPSSEIGENILYFTNPIADTHIVEVVSLHDTETVTAGDQVHMDSLQLEGILSQKDLLIPPAFVIRIQAGNEPNCLFDEQFNNKAPRFRVNFDSRQTYWKYYLHGKNADDTTYVYDPDNRVTFESADPVDLPDGRTLLTYRSQHSIHMHERYDFRFQLIQRKNGDERVLFRQLPCAGPGHTDKEVVADHAIAVSEIFINY